MDGNNPMLFSEPYADTYLHFVSNEAELDAAINDYNGHEIDDEDWNEDLQEVLEKSKTPGFFPACIAVVFYEGPEHISVLTEADLDDYVKEVNKFVDGIKKAMKGEA